MSRADRLRRYGMLALGGAALASVGALAAVGVAPSAPFADTTTSATTTAPATTSGSTIATTTAPTTTKAAKPPPTPKLVVTSTVTPTEATVGSTLTYTVSLKNMSATGPGVTVVDSLSAQVALVAVDADRGGVCSGSPPDLTCTWEAVNANVTVTMTIVVQVIAPGEIASSFETKATDPTTNFDRRPVPGPVTAGRGVAVRFASTATPASR